MSVPPVDRRRFIQSFLIAGPTLAVAARLGLDGVLAGSVNAEGFGTPEITNGFDGTDVAMANGRPFHYDLRIEVTKDNRVRFEVPDRRSGKESLPPPR
jgi:hypothetical protein